MAKQPLLLLDDNALLSLAANQSIVREFPFFGGLASSLKATKGCAPCKRAALQRERARQLAVVRQAIAGMPGGSKIRFKNLLNAERVRLTTTRVDPKDPRRVTGLTLTF